MSFELSRVLLGGSIGLVALALFLPSLLASITSISLASQIPYGDHQYEVQIFSREPLVLYIKNFVNEAEISYILSKSRDKFERTPVYSGFSQSFDDSIRVTETAILEPDSVLRKIRARARKLQGWRGKSLRLEKTKVQRYGVNGFFTFHYDWDSQVAEGNRATTFMIYLAANCTGGGTNFPELKMPDDARWCEVIDCNEGDDKYPGVTFNPIAGAAIYWENIHSNGSLDSLVRHAGLPVISGEKIGLNLWSWDDAWRPPVDGPLVAP